MGGGGIYDVNFIFLPLKFIRPPHLALLAKKISQKLTKKREALLFSSKNM